MRAQIFFFFTILSLRLQATPIQDRLSLKTVSGQYEAVEGVNGYDATEFPTLRLKALDAGDEPFFSRVEISFTCYWISHKDAIRFQGAGVGSIDENGVLNFAFVDEDGRHGTGKWRRQGTQYELSLVCSEHIEGSQHEDMKMLFVYGEPHLYSKTNNDALQRTSSAPRGKALTAEPTAKKRNRTPPAGGDVSRLISLIGKDKRRKEVQEFLDGFGSTPEVDKFKGDTRPDGSKGSPCEYYSYKDKGISIRIAGGVITSIFLYYEGADGFHQYHGLLPYGLRFMMNRKEIENKIGIASDYLGTELNVFASYPKKKMYLTYDSPSKTDMSAHLYEICLADE